jgi:hypothetical protein
MENADVTKKIRGYNDLIFRIILAVVASHVIVSFGAKESLFQLLLMWDYWRSFAISFLIAFFLINTVYWPTIYLDKRFDWRHAPAQRAGLQLLLGCIVPGILEFLLAAGYFRIFGIWILNTGFLRFDFPLILVMLLLLNLYYLAFYFYKQWQLTEMKIAQLPVINTTNKLKKKEVYMVQRGAKNIPLPIKNISYFFHDGDFNYLRTFEREDFVIPQPLDDLQKELPPQQFFRVNRQMLVNFSACEHFEPLEFGKLELIVKPKMKDSIIISQKRAKSFKDWIAK